MRTLCSTVRTSCAVVMNCTRAAVQATAWLCPTKLRDCDLALSYALMGANNFSFDIS
jgi:hypothetical protein